MAEVDVALRDVAVALPRWCLEAARWTEAWGQRTGQRRRAVAGVDEDSLTLAADAALEVVDDRPPSVLIAASTTAPCAERSTAAVLGVALRCGDGLTTADLAGSLRAATTAVALAADAVRRGEDAVVAAADCRDAEPGSDLEPVLGDAGAAVRLAPADEDALALLVARGVTNGDLPEVWRLAEERDVRRADPAFAPRWTMPAAVTRTLERALAAAEVAPGDVAHVATGAADLRPLQSAVARLGIPEEALVPTTRVQDAIGFAGVAAPLLALASALDRARPGELVACVGYGAGAADCLLWRVGDAVVAWQERGGSGLERRASSLEPIPSYPRFLRLRRRLPSERPDPYASMPLLAREQEQDLALVGSRCRDCGRVSFPMRRLCDACGGAVLEKHPLSRRGRLLTWTEDYIVPSPEPPTTMAVADLDGGGRFYGRLVAPAGTARPGLAVDLVLRRLHDGGGYPHYFWAMRPGDRSSTPEAGAAVAGSTAGGGVR